MTTTHPEAQQYQGAMTTRRVVEITGLPGHVIRRAIRQGHLSAIRPPGIRAWRVTEQALRAWLAAGVTPQNEAR